MSNRSIPVSSFTLAHTIGCLTAWSTTLPTFRPHSRQADAKTLCLDPFFLLCVMPLRLQGRIHSRRQTATVSTSSLQLAWPPAADTSYIAFAFASARAEPVSRVGRTWRSLFLLAAPCLFYTIFGMWKCVGVEAPPGYGECRVSRSQSWHPRESLRKTKASCNICTWL